MKESEIEDRIIKKLRYLQWFVKKLHGNMFQSGMPDLFCANYKYGIRLVEIKQPDSTKSTFTAAQLQDFMLLTAAGVGIWILTGDSDEQYAKLFQPANWQEYRFMKAMSKGGW